ncbi:MAG: TldD/PmbA family protein [Dehalococcoidales bacterium]|nr:TldD/PmbA family protein [Dehalococcoidales bacterium]
MEKILERAKKVAEAAEVFVVTSEETPVQFEANRLKHIQSRQSQIVALRIIRKGRVGYSVTTNHDNIYSLVDSAVETAEFGVKAGFELPALDNYPRVDTYDPDVEAVPLERMITLGEEMVSAVRGNTADIICEAGVDRDVISVRILNSGGGEASYRKSIFSMGIEASLIRGTDMLFVGESESSCHPLTDTRAVTDIVLRQLEWAKDRAAAPSKSLPVIFTPNGVASAIVSPLMAAFNGRIVLEGASPIGDSLGKPVFDKKLWLRDDATIAYRPASQPFDDEGVPSRRTTLIEAGVPAGFLYDLQTAALAKKQSTGNGGRHGGGLPGVSPNAFVIQPGDTTFDDMLADIKEGLVIEYLMGAGQGNILGGDFSGNVLLGYKVENGKIVGRVKDTMVSGNIYKLLKDIAAIGSDARWVGGSLSTPSLYFSSVSVASKG